MKKSLRDGDKFLGSEMTDFRNMHPSAQDWKKVCIINNVFTSVIKELEKFERQRIREDSLKSLTEEEMAKLLPFKEYLKMQKLKNNY